MAHLHSVYDTDKHFTIDPITRDITNKSSKVTLMQYDHNSERFTFEIPRMIEGHDMTLCNCVRIHFINIGNTKTNKSEGVYEVDDIQISPDSEDVIIFSWLIKRSATEYNGSLNFAVRFYCIAEDSTVDYSWGTNIFSGIKISNGLDNSDVIVDDYIDVLEKWKNEVLSSIPPETIRKIESLDLNNMLILRDLDSGTYVLYGEFKPYPEADSTISFSSDILVNIIRRTDDSQVQIFYPHNNCVQYLKITDTSYERTNVYLNDLATKVYVDQTIPTNVIQYSEQALTEEQKLQARQNIGAGKPQVQPDWNQNDETAPDYVKNRPFYTGGPVETVLVEENTVSFADIGGLYMGEFRSPIEVTIGETYKIYWDSVVYECICVDFNGHTVIGNLSIAGVGSDTGEPFFMIVENASGIAIFTTDTSASHTFSISGMVTPVVKIDKKYLPDTIATKSEVEAVQSTANTAKTTADNAQTAADKNKETLSQMLTYVSTFTFDKQTSGRDTFSFNAFNYYKISDFNPAPEDVISFKGTRENGGKFSKITIGSNCVEYGFFIVVASAGECSLSVTETSIQSFTAPSAGLYARYEESNQSQTAGTGEFTLMSIDGLTIKSSTYGSTKKFRITVDDSGTISATEVV